jgi:hypothetical protein
MTERKQDVHPPGADSQDDASADAPVAAPVRVTEIYREYAVRAPRPPAADASADDRRPASGTPEG